MDATPLSAADLAIAALAAVAAGAVNALAGGGTLITFPTLTALGLPAVAANVTNTIALAPGHLGATLAQKRDLAGQRARVRRLVPAALLGGLVGGLLLLFTDREGLPAARAVPDPARLGAPRRAGAGAGVAAAPPRRARHASHEGAGRRLPSSPRRSTAATSGRG